MERLDGHDPAAELGFRGIARRRGHALRPRVGRARRPARRRRVGDPGTGGARTVARGTSRGRSAAGPTGWRGPRPTTSATGRRSPAGSTRTSPATSAQCLIHNDFRFDNLVLVAGRPAAGDRRPRLGDGDRRRPADGSRRRAGVLGRGRTTTSSSSSSAASRRPRRGCGPGGRSSSTTRERTGLDVTPEQWRFYEVFGLFRLAVIAQQIWYRYALGQTTTRRTPSSARRSRTSSSAAAGSSGAERWARSCWSATARRPGAPPTTTCSRRWGSEQAVATGGFLAGVRPDAVVHGVMQRQRRTAELMAEAAGWSLAPRSTGAGTRWTTSRCWPPSARDFDGEPDAHQFQAWFEKATGRWLSGAHDGEYAESWPEFRDRVLAALDAWATAPPWSSRPAARSPSWSRTCSSRPRPTSASLPSWSTHRSPRSWSVAAATPWCRSTSTATCRETCSPIADAVLHTWYTYRVSTREDARDVGQAGAAGAAGAGADVRLPAARRVRASARGPPGR